MARVLVVRPQYDLATAYLSTYGQKILDFANEQGHQYVDLLGDNATLENFEREMDKQPNIVIGLSHGNTNTFVGQNGSPLLKVGVNDDIMKNKISYLWSCLTGVSLGPNMVSKGCPEYYGYQASFNFIYHPNYYPDRILEDPWAKAFMDCGLTTGYSVLLGQSPAEVFEATIERYNFWWDWWLQQEDPMADDIITWLNWNRYNFIAITPGGIYLEEKPTRGLIPVVLPLTVAAFFLMLSGE